MPARLGDTLTSTGKGLALQLQLTGLDIGEGHLVHIDHINSTDTGKYSCHLRKTLSLRQDLFQTSAALQRKSRRL